MAEDYLDRGWRRFGKMFFRPNCTDCSKCIPLRVDLQEFKLSKSMRKAKAKNNDIRIEIGPPQCTSEHIKLHNMYHKHQNKVKGWPHHNISSTEYRMLFCEPMIFAKEFRYFNQEDKLVGVGYVDTLPTAYSSLYFFYNPSWAPSSPGIFSILTEIQHAIDNGAIHYHLGYYVKKCPSMDYKLRFTPFDLLIGDEKNWPWDEANWKAIDLQNR
jgi:arginyl-tRNA--protein-N-Asp/Glu arginylyltransferase